MAAAGGNSLGLLRLAFLVTNSDRRASRRRQIDGHRLTAIIFSVGLLPLLHFIVVFPQPHPTHSRTELANIFIDVPPRICNPGSQLVGTNRTV